MDNKFEIPDYFIFDITSIPGSRDDVCKMAIEHYDEQKLNHDLIPELREIARDISNALKEYYSLASYNLDKNSKLPNLLSDLSNLFNFFEEKNNSPQYKDDFTVSSLARIKSFYSAYLKIIEKIIEYKTKGIEVPKKGIILDAIATREILNPKYDMILNPEALYKKTYAYILDFMEYIDELHKKDPRYYLREYDDKTLQQTNIIRDEYNNPNDKFPFYIPEYDFLDYALEIKALEKGYRYLPDISDDYPFEKLKEELNELKQTTDYTKLKSHSLLVKHIIRQTEIEQFLSYRNNIETNFFKKISNEEIIKQYKELDFDTFISIYGKQLSVADMEQFIFLNYLTEKINNTDDSKKINMPKLTNQTLINDTTNQLRTLKEEKERLIKDKINKILEININDKFESNCLLAQKLRKYNRCIKDYMRYPKQSLYQSAHFIIETPYGPIEKQIRTRLQDDYAEKGPSSHANVYKPNVRSTFHRLKVPSIIGPKRDNNDNIIKPIELGILPFEQAVREYYKQSFSNFANGLNYDDFHEQFKNQECFNQEAFDQAILNLSPKDISKNLLQKLKDKLSNLLEKKSHNLNLQGNLTINNNPRNNTFSTYPSGDNPPPRFAAYPHPHPADDTDGEYPNFS